MMLLMISGVTGGLHRKAFVVLRLWNHDVLNQTEGVLEQIRLAVDEQSFGPVPSPPTPLP